MTVEPYQNLNRKWRSDGGKKEQVSLLRNPPAPEQQVMAGSKDDSKGAYGAPPEQKKQ